MTPRTAWSRLQGEWSELRRLLAGEELDREAAADSFRRVIEHKRDGGLGELPSLSVALVYFADEYRSRGEKEVAEWLIDSARRLSPDSSAAEIAIARYCLVEDDFSCAASHYLSALRTAPGDFRFAFRMLGLAFIPPVLALGALGLILSLFFVFRYRSLLIHDFGDRMPFSGGLLTSLLTFAILALPVALGLSFWWLFAWWLGIFSLYMKRSEKVVAGLWMACLFTIPYLLEGRALMEGTRLDPVLQAVIRARNKVPAPDDLDLLKSEDGLLARFTAARLQVKSGGIHGVEEAVELYGPTLDDPLTSQGAHNNLAEIYYAANDFDQTWASLEKALESGAGSPEVIFNQSRYYGMIGQVRKQEDLEKALDVDKAVLMRYREESSGARKLNRVFVPIKAPRSLVWERAWTGSEYESALLWSIWRRWVGVPGPGRPFLFGSAGLLGFFLIMAAIGGVWRHSYRCSNCGRPICGRCDPPSKSPNLCAPCYHVFRGQSGVELKVKMEKRAEVQRYQDRWKRAGWVLSLLMPGSGHILLGFPILGATLFALFAGTWGLVFSGLLIWTYPFPFFNGGPPVGLWAAGIFTILLMSVSLLTYRSRSGEWG